MWPFARHDASQSGQPIFGGALQGVVALPQYLGCPPGKPVQILVAIAAIEPTIHKSTRNGPKKVSLFEVKIFSLHFGPKIRLKYR